MKTYIKTFIVFIIFVSSYNSFIFSQVKNWENYIAGGKKFTTIAEDNDFIWAGTDIGILRINKKTNGTFIYDKTNGFWGNTITAIAIDSNGNKWIGTNSDGLFKFDGINWKIFSISDSSLPSNNISALYFDKKGYLWIGSNIEGFTCLLKYNADSCLIYDINHSSLPNRIITSICEDDSSLWIATHGGLVKFDGLNWKTYTPSNCDISTVIINEIAVDNKNNKWLAAGRGLIKFNDSTFISYNENTPIWMQELNSISIDKNGNIWVGFFEGLVKFDQKNWTVFSDTNSGLPAHEVDVILTDEDNNKWIGTFDWQNNGRFVKFDEQNWTVFKTWKGDLISNYIGFIKQDSKGNIWIGLQNGLTKINGSDWTTYSTKDSLYSPDLLSFNSLTEDDKGNLWFSVLGVWPTDGSPPVSGLLKYDGNNWTEFRPYNSELPICAIYKIDFSQEDNSIWLGTSVGPVKFDGSTWVTLDTIINIIPKKNVLALKINGNIKWFGTIYGLIKYDGNNWQLYDTSNSDLPDNYIYDINIDNQNNLWISTYNGLAKFDRNVWTVFNTENSGLPNNDISNVDFDINNCIWVATYGGGIAEYDRQSWKVFNSQNSPIIKDFISWISIDKNGNKWIASDGWGISVYNENGISAIKNEQNQILLEQFILGQNYPNPFNPSTTIIYSLSIASDVQFSVYDLLGRQIIKDNEGFQNAGSHTIKFDGRGLSSGVYIYGIKVRKQFKCRKMLLIK